LKKVKNKIGTRATRRCTECSGGVPRLFQTLDARERLAHLGVAVVFERNRLGFDRFQRGHHQRFDYVHGRLLFGGLQHRLTLLLTLDQLLT
jgi:hypothetical protein